MWECPREQSRRRANTTALLADSHPAQRTWKKKATTARGRCSKTPNAGTGASRARNANALHESSQTDANCRSQGKGESVPTCSDELRVTVLEGLDSLPFQFSKNLTALLSNDWSQFRQIWTCPLFFLSLPQDEKGNTHLSLMPCV